MGKIPERIKLVGKISSTILLLYAKPWNCGCIKAFGWAESISKPIPNFILLCSTSSTLLLASPKSRRHQTRRTVGHGRRSIGQTQSLPLNPLNLIYEDNTKMNEVYFTLGIRLKIITTKQYEWYNVVLLL